MVIDTPPSMRETFAMVGSLIGFCPRAFSADVNGMGT